MWRIAPNRAPRSEEVHAMKEVVNSMQGPLDATRGAPGLTNKKLLVAFGRY